jgi:hypothetical protein
MRDQLANCTKLFVTHDMQAVHNFCSRVLVMEDGNLVFDGNVRDGVEAYLRSNHETIFRDSSLRNFESKRLVVSPDKPVIGHPISKEVMGGRGVVKFSSVFIRVNGRIIDAKSTTVFAGDLVELTMDFYACEAVQDLIFGYLILDRNGMHICGDNTLSLSRQFSVNKEESAVIHINFRWPAIASGSYTITLGIGNGRDPLNHVIECWAHSIFAFEGVSRHPVHGLFTNPIIESFME